jgi:hypothetical protein
MKTLVGLLLLWVLTLLAACGRGSGTAQVSSVDVTPTFITPPTMVIENQGGVCADFSQVVVRPDMGANGICASSSCTEVLDRGGTLRVDTEASAIYVTSRFVIQQVPGAMEGMVGCDADCGGAGELIFEEPLTPGVYAVWHGETLLGQIEVMEEGFLYDQCVELPYPTPTPEPYFGPTMTPAPTFAPLPTITPGPSPTALPPGMPYPGPGAVATAVPAPYPTP